MTSADMASICPLISQQPYIGHCFADPRWIRVHIDTEDRQPPFGFSDHPQIAYRYQYIFHLGYPTWPQRPLPFYILHTLRAQLAGDQTWPYLQDAELDLGTPWITLGARPDFRPWAHRAQAHIAVGFSDDHFELKYGLTQLLDERDYRWHVTNIGSSPRWDTEGGGGSCMNWAESVATLQSAHVFLGCNSGLHVLAVACGTPVVLMEPSIARHNDIFFPLGKIGPQVTLVTGNDGLPTFDARHVADALTQVLSTVPVRTHVEETAR